MKNPYATICLSTLKGLPEMSKNIPFVNIILSNVTVWTRDIKPKIPAMAVAAVAVAGNSDCDNNGSSGSGSCGNSGHIALLA